MSFEFSQVIAKLIQTVGFFGKLKTLENDLVNVLGAPGAEIVAAMQQNLQEPDDARLVDLDTCIVDRACGDRQGDALEQREVDVDVQPLRLEAGETIGDRQELGAHGVQVLQAFPETKVAKVIGAKFIAQQGAEFLVLLEEGVLPVGAEDMVTVFDLIDDGAQFAAQLLSEPHAEEFRDPVGSQAPKPDLAAALKDLMDREVALKDEVAAVLDLPDGVKARQVHLLTLALRELRSQDQCPVVELLLNNLWAKAVGGSLQRRDVVDSQKGVIVLAEGDLGSGKFLFDEGVTIEIIGGLEGQE